MRSSIINDFLCYLDTSFILFINKVVNYILLLIKITIIIIFYTYILSNRFFKGFRFRFTIFFIPIFKNIFVSSFRCFSSIKLANIMFLHNIIKSTKTSTFYNLGNKNIFGILNLTRIINTSLRVKLFIKIEVLLGLNLSINFFNINIFKFNIRVIQLFKQISIFFNSTISVLTSNKFIKGNERLSIIYFSISSITLCDIFGNLISNNFILHLPINNIINFIKNIFPNITTFTSILNSNSPKTISNRNRYLMFSTFTDSNSHSITFMVCSCNKSTT